MGTRFKAIREAASILAALLELKKTENSLLIYFIDALSHEYGWSVEYIQNLTLEEIAKLINHMKVRKDNEDIRAQINHAKAFAGKISSNREKSQEDSKEDDHSKLQKLSRALGKPIKEVEEDE